MRPVLGALLGHRFRIRGDRAEVVRGSNLTAKLFGLPFLLFGSAVLWATFFLEMHVDDSGEPVSRWIHVPLGLVVGLPIFGFGVAAVLGRWGVVVDRGAGTLERWFGPIVPVWRRRWKLGGSRRVVVTRSSRSSGSVAQGTSRSSLIYAVRLSGSGRPELDTFTSERAARSFAERAARTLGLGLENRLAEPPQIRKADELNRPLAERLADATELDVPGLPPDTRLRVEPGTAGGVVHLSRVGLDSWRGWAVAAVVVGFFGWLALPLLREGDAVSLGLALAQLAVGVFVLATLFSDELVAETLAIGPSGLDLTKALGPLRWHRHVPLSELEELYFDGDAVRAVSDARSLRLGGAHSEGDLAFLQAQAQAWLRRAVEAGAR